jgi:hypothetical protein
MGDGRTGPWEIIGCLESERASIQENRCPDCKQEGFFKGPQGGACTNIMCRNPACGSRFNVGPLACQRISLPMPLALAGLEKKNSQL